MVRVNNLFLGLIDGGFEFGEEKVEKNKNIEFKMIIWIMFLKIVFFIECEFRGLLL